MSKGNQTKDYSQLLDRITDFYSKMACSLLLVAKQLANIYSSSRLKISV